MPFEPGVDPRSSDLAWIGTWGMLWTAVGFFVFGIAVAAFEAPRMWLPFHLRNLPRWMPESAETEERTPLR